MLALKLSTSLCSLKSQALFNVYSLALNGTDEYVSADGIGNDINPNLGTYSVWVNLGAHSANGFIMQSRNDTDNQISLYYHNGNSELRFIWKGSGTPTTVASGINPESDGKWHHIAATWNTTSNEAKIYVDGVLKGTETITSSFSGTVSLFDIGQNTASAGWLNGNVSQAALFTREVPIGELFIANREPLNLTGLDGLVGYWECNEGSGTVAADSSGTGNTGTLYNTPAWSRTVPYKAN